MIEVYSLSSPNVMKVLILLEEGELPFRLHPINIWAQDQFSDAFKALNPNCKVPVIVDPDGPDGRAVTLSESGAILIYLAEKLGRFIPKDALDRLTMLQWLMFQMASVGPMFGQATHFRRAGPPGSEYSLSRYVTEVHRIVDVLETRLCEVPYLSGTEYSIADIATYPWISLYHKPNGIDLNKLPSVRRWLDSIESRPALVRVLEYWTRLREEDVQRKKSSDSDGLDRLFGRGRYARGSVA